MQHRPMAAVIPRYCNSGLERLEHDPSILADGVLRMMGIESLVAGTAQTGAEDAFEGIGPRKQAFVDGRARWRGPDAAKKEGGTWIWGFTLRAALLPFRQIRGILMAVWRWSWGRCRIVR